MGIVRTLTPVVFLGAALCLASVASAAPPPAYDRVVAGDVQKHGTVIVAGDRGATYELRGGAVIEFTAGSEFEFQPSQTLKLGKPNDPETLTRFVRLTHGSAEVTLPEGRKDTAVMLRAPSRMSAVAKEGKAAFNVSTDRTSSIARRGEMLVGVGTDWKPLRGGFARTLSPEDPSASPRAILAPPSVATDKALAMVSGEGTTGFTASWSAIKDADHYETTLVRLGVPKQEVLGRQNAAAPVVSFASLGAGMYGVVVSPVDKHGVRGNPSAPAVVRVFGVDIPEGAHSDGAVIVLGRNQRVALRGATGLELSFGTSPLFNAAPKAVGLAHNESTLVRLRAQGTTEEVRLQLEPDRLKARVAIGPKTAQWPGDRITLEVELSDPGRRPIPEGAEINTAVTVNLAPVNVQWARTGQTLRAELPPGTGTGSGPWVVRVEVKDKRGALIGRDFLEIAPRQAQHLPTAMR